MKKFFSIFVLILLISISSFAQDNSVISLKNDINPMSISLAPLATSNDYPSAIYDLLSNRNVDSLLGTVYAYGVCWTGSNYVTSRFSVNMFDKISSNWTKLDSFAASGAGTGFFRDLAYANGKIWGSPLSNIIYGIHGSCTCDLFRVSKRSMSNRRTVIS